MKRFVFTCGDINGIGPEIALKALNKITSKNKTTQFILIIPENIFSKALLAGDNNTNTWPGHIHLADRVRSPHRFYTPKYFF